MKTTRSLLLGLLLCCLGSPAAADSVTVNFDLSGSQLVLYGPTATWLFWGSPNGQASITYNANVTATQSTGNASTATNVTILGSGVGNGNLSFAGTGYQQTPGIGLGLLVLSGFGVAINAPSKTFANVFATGMGYFQQQNPFFLPTASLFGSGSGGFAISNLDTTGLAAFSGNGFLMGAGTTFSASVGTYVGTIVLSIGIIGQEVSRTFFDANPVPEPTTALLVGSGALALAMAALRRRRR